MEAYSLKPLHFQTDHTRSKTACENYPTFNYLKKITEVEEE